MIILYPLRGFEEELKFGVKLGAKTGLVMQVTRARRSWRRGRKRPLLGPCLILSSALPLAPGRV